MYYGGPYKFCVILNISRLLLIEDLNSGIMQSTLTDGGLRYEFVREYECTEEVWHDPSEKQVYG